jgi:outer membrane protein TolC
MRVLLFLLTLLHAPIVAQEQVTLTITQAIDFALTHNPGIAQSDKELSKARAGVGEAFSILLPHIEGYASLQHMWEIQTSRIPNFLKPMLAPLGPALPGIDQMPDFVDLAFGLENTLRYGATLTQPLFLGGAGLAAINIAQATRNAAEQNFQARKQQLILETALAFYSCLLAEELLAVQENALVQARANLDVVNKRYRVGTASPFDRMRAEVEVANLEPEVITARNNHKVALTRMRRVLGLGDTAGFAPEGAFRYVEDTFDQTALRDLQELALAGRPEMSMVEEQKKISQGGVAVARSNFLPKVVFQTDYSFLAMRNDLRFQPGDFSKGFSSVVSMQVPLFSGFASLRQHEKAQLDLRMIVDVRKQLADAILAEVEVSFNKFREGREKYHSARRTVDLATEALRLASLLYEEGANTQLDVLNSQLSLTRARLNYANILFEYEVARYQLRKATGKLTGALEGKRETP